jgi:SAP domain-containing ribonucleoprotein
MTKYAGLLKAKLQELLTARGLPVDGTKEVLIERLEESDKIAAELDEEEDETAAEVPAEAPQEAQDASVETATDAPAAPEAPEASIEESADAKTDAVVGDGDDVDNATTATAAQEEVVVTPELLKSKAVELLSRKLARAQKFGEDAQAAVLAADLARVEKFGVALDSIIARELGFGKPEPVVKKHGNIKGQNKNKNKNKNKNRNKGKDKTRLAEQRPHAVHSGRVYKTRY